MYIQFLGSVWTLTKNYQFRLRTIDKGHQGSNLNTISKKPLQQVSYPSSDDSIHQKNRNYCINYRGKEHEYHDGNISATTSNRICCISHLQQNCFNLGFVLLIKCFITRDNDLLNIGSICRLLQSNNLWMDIFSLKHENKAHTKIIINKQKQC